MFDAGKHFSHDGRRRYASPVRCLFPLWRLGDREAETLAKKVDDLMVVAACCFVHFIKVFDYKFAFISGFKKDNKEWGFGVLGATGVRAVGNETEIS